MSQTRQTSENSEVEILISGFLKAGVVISAATVFLGGVIYLFTRGSGLIQLGLALLTAIPAMRVALSIIAFLRRKDALYVVITSIVFSILMYSVFGR